MPARLAELVNFGPRQLDDLSGDLAAGGSDSYKYKAHLRQGVSCCVPWNVCGVERQSFGEPMSDLPAMRSQRCCCTTSAEQLHGRDSLFHRSDSLEMPGQFSEPDRKFAPKSRWNSVLSMRAGGQDR